ncbi:MAG: hypothetical protein WCH20_10215 [Nitrospira sp.]
MRILMVLAAIMGLLWTGGPASAELVDFQLMGLAQGSNGYLGSPSPALYSADFTVDLNSPLPAAIQSFSFTFDNVTYSSVNQPSGTGVSLGTGAPTCCGPPIGNSVFFSAYGQAINDPTRQLYLNAGFFNGSGFDFLSGSHDLHDVVNSFTTTTPNPYTLSPFYGGGASLSVNGTSAGQIDFQSGSLSVAPVPVPAAAVLFGSGLIGLLGWQRKRLRKMV